VDCKSVGSEIAKPQRLRCPHCGAELIYRRTILPKAGPRIRIAALIDHLVEQAMSKTLDSGP
jgi:DNA-directed RNA polymerase subunit RPC12/RpoP